MPRRPDTSVYAPVLGQKLGAEFVGTFFATLVPTGVDVLYFTGGGVDFVSRWLARGFVTASLIYAFSEISGAHVNPAVSLAFALRRDIDAARTFAYWIAQCAGAFAAAGLAFALWGRQIALGASHPSPGYSHVVALITEIVATYLLIAVVLMTAEQKGSVGKQAAIAVGLVVAACGFVAGPISGASMNPARSIAPQILGGSDDLIWIYVAGPCLGAALAAFSLWLIGGPPDADEAKAAHGR